jgi:hypothetical protein
MPRLKKGYHVECFTCDTSYCCGTLGVQVFILGQHDYPCSASAPLDRSICSDKCVMTYE